MWAPLPLCLQAGFLTGLETPCRQNPAQIPPQKARHVLPKERTTNGSVLGDPDSAVCPHHGRFLLTITIANCWTPVLGDFCRDCALPSNTHADQDGLATGRPGTREDGWEGAENTHNILASKGDPNGAPKSVVQLNNTPTPY